MVVTVNERRFSGTIISDDGDTLLLRLKPYNLNNCVMIKQGKYTFMKIFNNSEKT